MSTFIDQRTHSPMTRLPSKDARRALYRFYQCHKCGGYARKRRLNGKEYHVVVDHKPGCSFQLAIWQQFPGLFK